MSNDVLIHYGVLGMKWGVRKDGGSRGSNSNSNRNARKAAKSKVLTIKKNRSTLSDKQLDKQLDRLKKEKQLKDLTEEEYEPVKKFVKDVMSKSGKKIAVAAVTAAVPTAAKVAVDSKNQNAQQKLPGIDVKPNSLAAVMDFVSQFRNQAKNK